MTSGQGPECCRREGLLCFSEWQFLALTWEEGVADMKLPNGKTPSRGWTTQNREGGGRREALVCSATAELASWEVTWCYCLAAAAVAMVLQWAEGEAQTGGVDAPVSTFWLPVLSCWAGLRTHWLGEKYEINNDQC